eukprot:13054992-Alexandrium_andersonii.AAC.1
MGPRLFKEVLDDFPQPLRVKTRQLAENIRLRQPAPLQPLLKFGHSGARDRPVSRSRIANIRGTQSCPGICRCEGAA